MKKILIIFSLFILMISCNIGKRNVDASKKEEKDGIVYITNEKKPFTGKIIAKYEDGKLKTEENFKDGKYEGISKEYFSNGQLAFEGTFKNGKLNGEVKTYFENG